MTRSFPGKRIECLKPVELERKKDLMVGRAGFEPATHRFLRFPEPICMLDRLGDPTAEVAEVYSVFVTMEMVARKLYQAELPPAHRPSVYSQSC